MIWITNKAMLMINLWEFNEIFKINWIGNSCSASIYISGFDNQSTYITFANENIKIIGNRCINTNGSMYKAGIIKHEHPH